MAATVHAMTSRDAVPPDALSAMQSQADRFWSVQGRLLDLNHQFATIWLDRRHRALQSAAEDTQAISAWLAAWTGTLLAAGADAAAAPPRGRAATKE